MASMPNSFLSTQGSTYQYHDNNGNDGHHVDDRHDSHQNYCNIGPNDVNRRGYEDLILATINDFNNKFNHYKTAYDTYIKNKTGNTNDIINEYNDISKKLKQLKSYVDDYTRNYSTVTDNSTSYDNIIGKYNQMVESRKKLDQQIYDLYVNDYDSVYSNKPSIDSNIVTGLLWTMFVTIMLYYVIIKM